MLETAEGELDRRGVTVFVVFAFGISWLTAAVIYLTGGFGDSPVLVEGTPITLAAVLVPSIYMFSPAIANLLTRVATREGFGDLYLRPGFRPRYFGIAWLAPPVLSLAGAATYFLIFPDKFSRPIVPDFGLLWGIWSDFSLLLLISVFFAPFVNLLFAFGEEWGWRAYLLPKLLPLGFRPASIIVGVVWGVWHWPLIAMGVNYGSGYIGYPVTGFVLMALFTVVSGVFLAWVAVREGSVWSAALGHGSINASAGIGTVFILVDGVNPLLGPAPTGMFGMVPWLVAAALILYMWSGTS